MINLNKITLGETISDDIRPLFAPYSNIAQCNIHNVLTYMSKRIGLTPEKFFTDSHLEKLRDDAEGKLRNFSLEDAIHNTQDLANFRILSPTDYKGMLPEQKTKLKQLFDEHLKMSRPFYNVEMATCSDSDENVYLQYCKILKNLLIVLNNIRNLTSHKNGRFKDNQQKSYEAACRELLCARKIGNNVFFSPMKNGLYDNSLKIITDRFNLQSHVVNKLNRYTKKEGKFVQNSDFFLKMDVGDVLSGVGMLFVVCMFLTKKQVYEFIQGLHLEVPGLELRYVGELLSVFRIVLPRNKIQSIYPNIAYALDMLNELRKCPDELFETLSPGDQQKLRNEGDNEGEYKKLLKRNSDRFAYFAQRYIDSMEIFKKIRFQVSLGKYRYKFYNKQCVDSASANRVRILQKELNGFGRLDEIEKVRTERWMDHIRVWNDVHQDTAEEKPYITDQHAGYVVYRNKIGLFYPTDYNKVELKKMYQEDGCYLPKILPEKAACMSPVCWLSIYELPALIFHQMICGNTEDRIIECVDRYYRLFNDVVEGRLKPLSTEDEVCQTLMSDYNIEATSVPGNIIDYLTGKSKDIQKAISKRLENVLEEEINWTNRRLKRQDRDDASIADVKANKIGRKHVEVKPGRLAGILMDDIVRLMPSNETGTNKPTGLNFSVMQSELATYSDGNTDAISRMFVSAGICQSKYEHPFLHKVLSKQPKNTLSFYKNYLDERLRYMEGLLKKLKMGKIQGLLSLSFLIKGNKWVEKNEDFYRKLAKRYLLVEQDGCPVQKTIDLPRNIFLKDVKAELKKKCAGNIEMIDVLNNPNANMAMLIGCYFRTVKNNSNQDFYNWPRSYGFLNQVKRMSEKAQDVYMKPEDIIKFYGDKQQKELAVNNIVRYTKLKEGEDKNAFKENAPAKVNRMYNEMCSNEKNIRRYKVQDFIILEMAKKFLEQYDEGSDWDKIKMQDISATSDKSILDRPVCFSIKLKSGNNYNKCIKVNNIKIKDMSKVETIKTDNRMPTLLDLIRCNEIPLEDIQKELENYDIEQKKVFVDITKVEDLAGADGGNFGEMVKGINPDNSVMNSQDSKLLVNIRNSFSHNAYLDRKKSYVPCEIINAETEQKSKRMYDNFRKLIYKLNQNLEQSKKIKMIDFHINRMF